VRGTDDKRARWLGVSAWPGANVSAQRSQTRPQRAAKHVSSFIWWEIDAFERSEVKLVCAEPKSQYEMLTLAIKQQPPVPIVTSK
jgi:hypothetical protein